MSVPNEKMMEGPLYRGYLPTDDIPSPAIKSDDLEDLIFGDETRLSEFYSEFVSPWAECVLAREKTQLEIEEEAERPVSLLPENGSAGSPKYLISKPQLDKLINKPIESTLKKLKCASVKNLPVKTYPKVKLEDIKKQDLADFRSGKVDLESSHSLIGHPEMFFQKSGAFKLDLRTAVFDRMPARYQHEIMNLLPRNYVEITKDGRMQLKPGTFSKGDEKFKRHLRAFQFCLKTGEYDPDIRRTYIEMSADKMDPWKVENFEPVYGDLCTYARVAKEGPSSSATSMSSTNDSAMALSSLASARSSPTDIESIGRSEKENETELNSDQDKRSSSEDGQEELLDLAGGEDEGDGDSF